MARLLQYRLRTLLLLQLVIAIGVLTHNVWWPHLYRFSLRPVDSRPIAWEPFTAKTLADAQQDGRPVLVFFGADWDLIKKASLGLAVERPRVRRMIADYRVVPIMADFTNYEKDEVHAECKRLNGFCQQMVVVYSPDASSSPTIIRSAVSEQQLVTALQSATQDQTRRPPLDMYDSPLVGVIGIVLLIVLAHAMSRTPPDAADQ